jgi:nitroreductase
MNYPNDVISQLMQRRSVRSWEDTPVTAEHIQTIKETVLRGPSAGNMMLYSVIDITDSAKKAALAKLCDNQPMIERAPLLWLFAADYQKWMDYYEASGAVEEGKRRGIPESPPGTGDLFISICDALIAAQSAVTAADSLQVGSCYIGDILEQYEQVKELLDLPRYVFPITMVCFGYPKGGWKTGIPETPKHRAEDIFHTDRYRRKGPKELLEMFSAHDDYYRSHNRFNKGIENTGSYFYLRKHTSDFMEEMTRSTTVMLKNWMETE